MLFEQQFFPGVCIIYLTRSPCWFGYRQRKSSSFGLLFVASSYENIQIDDSMWPLRIAEGNSHVTNQILIHR